MQRPQPQCTGVLKDARATHPRRGRTMSRDREGERRGGQRKQLQRYSITPREAGGEEDTDYQPPDARAIECERRTPVQRQRGNRDRRNPQRQVEPRRVQAPGVRYLP